MDYQKLISLKSAQEAPASSFIVLADVRGSTAAIKAGRYRDVNMIGTACIAAIRNNFSARRVPYVFGGDGATFLVEADDLEICLHHLSSVQRLAQGNLRLDLRVGYLQVSKIRELGGEIFYGFLSWSETECLPFFRGDGLSLAEKLIKETFPDELPQWKKEDSVSNEAVKGVSCRLEPFASLRGRVLSILVEPTVPFHEEDAVFQQIFSVVQGRGTIARLSPVTRRNMKRGWVNTSWWGEARLQSKASGLGALIKSSLATLISFLLVKALFRFQKNTEVMGDPEAYTQALLQQSDWIKIDGTLRLVIDVEAIEEQELRKVLGELEAQGKLLYGIHASKSALMTCHFQSGVGQRHVHFIDGSDGGLTLAAVELKRKKVSQSPAPALSKKGA